MKIALLFTGRSNNFRYTANYLGAMFKNAHRIDTVDVFAHEWSDDFSRMIHLNDTVRKQKNINDTKEYMLQRLVPSDTESTKRLLNNNFDNVIKHTSSSQQELLNMWVDASAQHDPKPGFYIMSIAQLLSYNNAMHLWRDHVTETGDKYDLVIRWRYDLLLSHLSSHTSRLLHSIEDNDILLPGIDWKEKMLCDYSWAMTHDTALNSGMQLYDTFKDILHYRIWEKNGPRERESYYNSTENMLLEAFTHLKLNIRDDRRSDGAFSPVIWRKGCTNPIYKVIRGNDIHDVRIYDNVLDIQQEADNIWIDKGWNHRIALINKTGKKSDF